MQSKLCRVDFFFEFREWRRGSPGRPPVLEVAPAPSGGGHSNTAANTGKPLVRRGFAAAGRPCERVLGSNAAPRWTAGACWNSVGKSGDVLLEHLNLIAAFPGPKAGSRSRRPARPPLPGA